MGVLLTGRQTAAEAGDSGRDRAPDPVLTIHTVPPGDVYPLLSTSPSGLSADQAAELLLLYEPNTISPIRKRSVIIRFLMNFTHLMAILLWIGGFVAFIAEMPALTVAIWMVNLINGLFSFWQEYRAEKASEALMKLLPRRVHVIREGQTREIPAEELVPGDLMALAEGDHISADGRVVASSAIRIDQSTLTGESHPVKKTADAVVSTGLSRIEYQNLVFAGTNVVSGSATAVVVATGMKTEFGKVAGLTQTITDELSPLQKEMVYVTRMVTIVAVSAGVLFFALLELLTPVSTMAGFIFSLGMIVAFVPEGLLPTVTLSLARGSQRMAKRNALIKRLSAVETLGCTSVICTDKTGTLTENEMTVREIWIPDRVFPVTGGGYTPEGEIVHDVPPSGQAEGDLSALLSVIALCNNARLLPPDPAGGQPGWSILGDPTEAALIVAAWKGGVRYDEENRRYPRIRENPFDSRRKMMSTLHQSGTGTGTVLCVKGAPLGVLALSSRIRSGGADLLLDQDTRDRIVSVHDEMAKKGLRVLGVAQRSLSPGTGDDPETMEQDLTFLGLVAMMDPPRPEVADAVARCRRAAIRIIMITGDYGLTARSIAQKVGIITDRFPRIITGSDLDSMDDDHLKESLAADVIFARVAPEHKLRVVATLREMGHIVAVTGDGVNDAPALKKADIGVAMGITGTDVAKEAADMVLTDDNFASIVNAIEEGRAVYANIKKFTGYIFTSNTPEAVPFILFAFSKARIPLALDVMHILSIDLGTDLLPALALGSEPPEEGIMDKPPRNLNEHVITRALLVKSYLWLGMIQSAAAMSAFYFQYWTNGYWGRFFDLPSSGPLYESATAMALAAVVTSQIGNVLVQRTERRSIFEAGLFSSPMVWIGIVSELVIILLIIYVPFLQDIIGTAPFPPENWLFLFLWAPVLVILEELRKWVARRWDLRKTNNNARIGQSGVSS